MRREDLKSRTTAPSMQDSCAAMGTWIDCLCVCVCVCGGGGGGGGGGAFLIVITLTTEYQAAADQGSMTSLNEHKIWVCLFQSGELEKRTV